MAPSPIEFALRMIKNNPKFANNPQYQNYIQILESGDAQKGEELANNLLNTYGVTKEDALAQAKNFFHIPL